MPNEVPLHDPTNIWQSQTQEPFKMSLEQLRHRAQRRHSKARREAVTSIAAGFVLCATFARTFAAPHPPLARAGLALLSLWGLYFAYQAYKWIWPGAPKPDATASATRDSYRAELERRRDYVRHLWSRSGLTFCLLGVALFLVPQILQSLATPGRLANVAPVALLFILWLAIFFPMRLRRRRRLQQEIDELRA